MRRRGLDVGRKAAGDIDFRRRFGEQEAEVFSTRASAFAARIIAGRAFFTATSAASTS
jgi:hypothetical protein